MMCESVISQCPGKRRTRFGSGRRMIREWSRWARYIQGFEFDYIGVIVGNDLVYDAGKQQWQSVPRNSHDTQVKRNNPDLARHLQNVYRVLMSRAHPRVYVYFIDVQTEQPFT